MQLSHVVPWGRSLHEYSAMFALTTADLRQLILGCGDGPASFNAETTSRGHTVTSVDPVYAFSRGEIKQRVEDTYDRILSQVRQNPQRYVWRKFDDADDLGRARMAAMKGFLDDFEVGKAQGRYLPDALPALRFAGSAFDLALCSHLLFLYSEQLSLQFHLDAIAELLRVAGEVRIFPILGLDCQVSPHLEPVRDFFVAAGYNVEVVTVDYEFQVGGNEMLRLR